MVLSFGQNIAPNAFGGGTMLGEFFRKQWYDMTFISMPPGPYGTPGGSYPMSFPVSSSGTAGNFTGRNNVYLGLKVTDNGTDYYGWVEISVSGFAHLITLHSWAYDDEGNDIQAGAIPEPGHIGLLAAGAAGLLAWRRKRQQVRAEAGSETEGA